MLNKISKYFIAIILVLKLAQGSPVTKATENLALSKDAVRLNKSQEILKYMNVSVNPCDDFYEFSCGNYAKYNPTNPPAEVNINSLQKVAKSIDAKKKILLETDEDVGETDVDRKVKQFYRSCLNTGKNLSDYKKKLLEVIGEFGSMPLVEGMITQQETNFDWQKTIAKIIYKTGFSIILDIRAERDFTNKSISRIYFGEPLFFLQQKSLYIDETMASIRENYRLGVAFNLHKLLGIEMELADHTAKEIIDFEIALAQGMHDNKLDQSLGEIYTLLDIDKVQRQYLPFWDSMKLINDSMGCTPTQVYIKKQYLDNALEVLKNTSPRQVANYVFYTYLTNFVVKIKNTRSEMERYCYLLTKENFYKNLDNMIYRKYIHKKMKNGLHSMWEELKLAFQNTLQSTRLNWLQEDTRKHAIEKLNAMKLDILSYEEEHFEEKFSELNFNDQDFVHNIKSLLTRSGNQARARIHKPPQSSDNGAESSFTPTYSQVENAVKLPISLLQSQHLWSNSYPQAFNLGSMGALVSHEILHGFDNKGRHFDAYGNLRDWWDPQSSDKFLEGTKCFINQYKKYIFGGKPLPEMQSQLENIADNGGVRLAYETYLNWYNKNVGIAPQSDVSLESLPGLEYSYKQLFFISYGQDWCSNIDPTYAAFLATYDTHVPPKFRVIGSLSNFDEFSKEFNCPKGSTMNPVKKCEIF